MGRTGQECQKALVEIDQDRRLENDGQTRGQALSFTQKEELSSVGTPDADWRLKKTVNSFDAAAVKRRQLRQDVVHERHRA